MIKVEIEGWRQSLARIAGMGKQVQFAARRALNETAKKVVDEERRAIAKSFDKPTPRTLNSVKVFSGATKEDLSVTIGVDDGHGRKTFKSLGKKGTVTPAKYLLAQITGGRRAPKRFERALIAIGAMDPGDSAVFAKRSNALDQYGNLSGAQISQIITYFRTVKVAGYGGVMSKARKTKMMKGELKGMKWGKVYFRGGGKTGLEDGIWERHYPNGAAEKSFIRPILIYVRGASYQRKLMLSEIAERVVAKEWRKQFDSALSMALSTAK